MITKDKTQMDVQRVTKTRLNEVDWKKLGFGNYVSDHLFIAEYANRKWEKSRIVPYGNFSVSPAMMSLHYGQAIFEGMKAYRYENGEVYLFRPLDNHHRLNVSAERMAMPTVPQDLFMEGLMELIKQDVNWVPKEEGSSLYIRPVYFATEAHIGVKIAEEYSLMIMTCPVAAFYSQPLKVLVETNYTRAVSGGVGYAKTAGNYGRSHHPTRLAQQKGYNQLIWTDGKDHQYIEESGAMNVMCVINGTLVTPELSDTILAGITRDSVLTVAHDLGIKVEERKIRVDELVSEHAKGTLQEMFGVGTAATIAPICLFGNNGKDYALPPISATSTGARIKATLDKIRTGKAADKHGWMVKVY
jgi:branched-chain amino acid aminotransferase